MDTRSSKAQGRSSTHELQCSSFNERVPGHRALGTGLLEMISLTRRERESAKSDNGYDNEDEGDSSF